MARVRCDQDVSGLAVPGLAVAGGAHRAATGRALVSHALLALEHVESDVDDHVLLSADHFAAADLGQDGPGIDAVVVRGFLGVAQEGRIDPSIAERQRLSPHRLHQHQRDALAQPGFFVTERKHEGAED